MWEKLTVYRRLNKEEFTSTFKQFGIYLSSQLEGYRMVQIRTIIKIFRNRNGLEQSIFLERNPGDYYIKVYTCIKPDDFYRTHKFSIVNQVSLGLILNNHRKSSFPLTKEWSILADYLVSVFRTDGEDYFLKYDSYQKIITQKHEIESGEVYRNNSNELLIFAAIKTRHKELLTEFLTKQLSNPLYIITYSEYMKPLENEVNESQFLNMIRLLNDADDFDQIDLEIKERASGK